MDGERPTTYGVLGKLEAGIVFATIAKGVVTHHM